MIAATDPHASHLLSKLTRASLEPSMIDRIHATEVYQITEGWQREILLRESSTMVAETEQAFADALLDADIATIFVPKETLMQEAIERSLQHNFYVKTIIWEI